MLLNVCWVFCFFLLKKISTYSLPINFVIELDIRSQIITSMVILWTLGKADIFLRSSTPSAWKKTPSVWRDNAPGSVAWQGGRFSPAQNLLSWTSTYATPWWLSSLYNNRVASHPPWVRGGSNGTKAFFSYPKVKWLVVEHLGIPSYPHVVGPSTLKDFSWACCQIDRKTLAQIKQTISISNNFLYTKTWGIFLPPFSHYIFIIALSSANIIIINILVFSCLFKIGISSNRCNHCTFIYTSFLLFLPQLPTYNLFFYSQVPPSLPISLLLLT